MAYHFLEISKKECGQERGYTEKQCGRERVYTEKESGHERVKLAESAALLDKKW